jgi:phenylalanyl-tRNA synthetase beta chain
MKVSYAWLQEWVEMPWDPQELGSRLTMAGFELEGIRSHAKDSILEINVTPNRGDAMSILGIAREIAALAGRPLRGPASGHVAEKIADTFPVHVEAPAACPTFLGRVFRNINNRASTPAWLTERLQSADVRSVSPVVDVTNYVLLELGQPMHAYDLSSLQDEIRVRYARSGEKLQLLDGRTVDLTEDMLVIADRNKPIGLAGVMGGAHTGVATSTVNVFLEVAYFAPSAVQGRGRRLGLLTDASQRYERGVDPGLQQRALERASELLLQIAGGEAGPVIATESREHQPRRAPVELRRTQLARLLGAQIAPGKVTSVLTALQIKVEETPAGWRATPPSHRADITIEADLIEEVARMVGFDQIAEVDARVAQRFAPLPRARPPGAAILELMSARGYQEAITYAFVDPQLQQRLFPGRPALVVENPIASDLSTMRISLWPGLLRAAAENERRQQERIRLMERGVCFTPEEGTTREEEKFAALACGGRLPEQWGVSKEARGPADFFDIKADLEMLLVSTGAEGDFEFEPAQLSCLHPGRAAGVLRGGHAVGWIGELHPEIVRELDFTYPPVLFELAFYDALRVHPAPYRDVPRFPMVRRDLAIVVDESVSLSALRERVVLSASSLLRQCRVFDVYRGLGLEIGTKSIALGLIFQDFSRTLIDEDVDRNVESIVAGLRASLNAKIRD